jgi:hypothetical protein
VPFDITAPQRLPWASNLCDFTNVYVDSKPAGDTIGHGARAIGSDLFYIKLSVRPGVIAERV